MNVKLFRIITGEEVIAEVLTEEEETVTIQNGLVVIPSGQSVGFAPWAYTINKDEPEITINRSHILFIAKVDEGVEGKYHQVYGATNPLITPDKKKLIL